MKSYNEKAINKKSNSETRIPREVLQRVGEIHSEVKDGLMGLAFTAGLSIMKVLIEEEITQLADPKGKHDPNKIACRHGSEPSNVTFGGRKVSVSKPRMRSNGGEEIPVETFRQFQSEDPLGIAAALQ